MIGECVLSVEISPVAHTVGVLDAILVEVLVVHDALGLVDQSLVLIPERDVERDVADGSLNGGDGGDSLLAVAGLDALEGLVVSLNIRFGDDDFVGERRIVGTALDILVDPVLVGLSGVAVVGQGELIEDGPVGRAACYVLILLHTEDGGAVGDGEEEVGVIPVLALLLVVETEGRGVVGNVVDGAVGCRGRTLNVGGVEVGSSTILVDERLGVQRSIGVDEVGAQGVARGSIHVGHLVGAAEQVVVGTAEEGLGVHLVDTLRQVGQLLIGVERLVVVLSHVGSSVVAVAGHAGACAAPAVAVAGAEVGVLQRGGHVDGAADAGCILGSLSDGLLDGCDGSLKLLHRGALVEVDLLLGSDVDALVLGDIDDVEQLLSLVEDGEGLAGSIVVLHADECPVDVVHLAVSHEVVADGEALGVVSETGVGVAVVLGDGVATTHVEGAAVSSLFDGGQVGQTESVAGRGLNHPVGASPRGRLVAVERRSAGLRASVVPIVGGAADADKVIEQVATIGGFLKVELHGRGVRADAGARTPVIALGEEQVGRRVVEVVGCLLRAYLERDGARFGSLADSVDDSSLCTEATEPKCAQNE